MPERTDRERLQDLHLAIVRALEYVSGMSYESFRADTKTQDAVIRNLEVIGEATKGLSTSTRTRHAEIPWRQMAGMRDRLIHDYFGVNLDIVWQVVDLELPQLQRTLEVILAETSHQDP